MTSVSKSILRNSINTFLASTSEEKERYIQVVQKNLNDHLQAMNCIGMGYCEHVVTAGKIFMRIFGTKTN